MVASLYIHIPFCHQICSYCDFCKLLYNEKFSFSYIKELKKEILSYPKRKYKTIYVGGGTPTSLNDDLFDDILSFLSSYLDKDGEFTVEANPESLTKRKCEIMKKNGVNRLSIGLQTTSNEMLNLLNRCSFETFQKAYEFATSFFDNINVDLMYALPGESLEDLEKDVDYLLKIKPRHISTYSLILEEGTSFKVKGYKEADEDTQASQYEYILKRLRDSSYKRYEVSNYSLEGYESKHNLTYWKDEEYVGCGLGASGYLDGRRYTNTRSLKKYLQGEYIDDEFFVEEDKDKFFFLTSLRLADGFLIDEFKEKTGHELFPTYQEEIDKLVKEGLLINKESRILPTDKGILLLDRVLLSLFK